MLTQLSIRNFVLIESLDLELGQGLNVLSGGSGEGKTLLLNALQFVMGHGANGKGAANRWVRTGAKETKVRVVFECPEGKRVLERSLSAAGRGRCSFNEELLTLPEYHARGSRLGEFFGQGQAQRLVESDAQRQLLDAVAGTRDLAERFASAREELLSRARTHDRLAREEEALRLDWSEHQAQRDALAALEPEAGEFEGLVVQVDRVEARADQTSALSALARDLEGDDHGRRGEAGLCDAAVDASAALLALCAPWPELQAAQESLAHAVELIQEASRGVACAQADAAFDPRELETLRERERGYRSLARRLSIRPEQLAARWDRLRTLDPEAIAQERAALALRLRRGRKELASISSELSEARRTAAQRLAQSVLERLPELGLGEARFEVAIVPCLHTLSQEQGASPPRGSLSHGLLPREPLRSPHPMRSAGKELRDSSGHSSSYSSSSSSYSSSSSSSSPGGHSSPGGDSTRETLAEDVVEEPRLLERHPSPHGDDSVELRFSANPALPLGSLREASGGELGRVFLALGLEAPADAALLVFDEVDQNVGARLGSAVGACLDRMSRSRQVLAITHLAPVAARAKLHHRITKRGGVTQVETLTGERRVEELALMIRGEPITPAARAQARELLDEAHAAAGMKPPTRGKAKGKPKSSKHTSPPPLRKQDAKAPAKKRQRSRVSHTGAA